MSHRRLPVYLLLDCSESMAGPAIEAVSRGVNIMLEELMGNPLTVETAYLSVITFSREAKQIVPLTELMEFIPPKLSIRPGTALGGALHVLIDCLKREIIQTTEKIKGDYKPLVFILTDGQPTDKWEEYADEIRMNTHPKVANIYAIGCGPDVDFDILHRITDIVLNMPELTPESFSRFFIWLTASIQTASVKLTRKLNMDIKDLPGLPADVLEIANKFNFKKQEMARQIFMHSICSKTGLPYLMRYSLITEKQKYYPVASHRLDVLEEGDKNLLPPVNSSVIRGCPPCPYCNNRSLMVCDCGTMFCDCGKDNEEPVFCPGCKSKINVIHEDGIFEIKQSQG